MNLSLTLNIPILVDIDLRPGCATRTTNSSSAVIPGKSKCSLNVGSVPRDVCVEACWLETYMSTLGVTRSPLMRVLYTEPTRGF